MRALFACLLSCAVLFAQALGLSAQSLPQISDARTLRALVSPDAARGWEAVGRLESDVGFCSASLVAPHLVLTAAHCLFDAGHRRIADHALRFAAGLRQGQAAASRGVKRSIIPSDYHDSDDPPSVVSMSRDIALLELDQPIVSAVVVPMRTGPRGRVRDVVTIISYGRDRADHASLQEDCEIIDREGGVIALTCDVVAGASGAPILRETPSGLEIVAVVSAMGEFDHQKTAFAVDVDAVLPSLLAAMGQSDNSPTVRRQVVGDGGRGSLGARFIRP